jgi:hypothetical protein
MPGMGVRACNPSSLGDRDRRFTIQGQSGQEISETLSQRTSCARWCPSINLVKQEVKVGLPSKISPVQKYETLFEKQRK